jgi:arginase
MYRLIGAASGWGAQIRECEEGPEVLKNAHLLEALRDRRIPIRGWEMLYPSKRAKNGSIPLNQCLPLIHDINFRLAGTVERALSLDEFPIVIGGDHSIAVGTWNGAYQFFKKANNLPFGLIWIDAHMDAHTSETTPSGAWHGMPLAGLLGHGVPSLAALKEQTPVLLPEHLCLIGCRSFEEGEAALLKRLNVRIYFDQEVKERGIQAVLQEAVEYIKSRTKVFGVSIDLDVIDPEQAPGVGSSEPNGLDAYDVVDALQLLEKEEQFKLFELVEFNPRKAHYEKTAKICFDVLEAIMKKQAVENHFAREKVSELLVGV